MALVDAVLKFLNFGCSYLLDFDTSIEGVGAMLSQVKDGQGRVVAYYSTKFMPNERNYCVTRKELQATVKSFLHFHSYLYSARIIQH